MTASDHRDHRDLRDLATDLPTRPDDIRALRAARVGSAMTVEEIANVARQLAGPTPRQLRARPAFRGEPFTLEASSEPE